MKELLRDCELEHLSSAMAGVSLRGLFGILHEADGGGRVALLGHLRVSVRDAAACTPKRLSALHRLRAGIPMPWPASATLALAFERGIDTLESSVPAERLPPFD